MRALVVRPFGQREGIDFDQVDRLLVGPALRALRVVGGTTEELVSQGNIREDMFSQLLKCDLVVVDMSIHNANVFYELGVRHALRDKHTFLIRCRKDEVPFDLRTDRYLEYDAAEPQAALPRLIEALRQTLDGERGDSPVIKLVAGLQAQDWTRFLDVPRDFTEQVLKAARRRRNGDLDLLAAEIESLEWEFEGLKRIGRELYALRFNASAKAVWERVVAIKDDDAEAWGSLATIYQRLGSSTDSERALERVLDLPSLAPNRSAKLYALRGSHEKRHWRDDWQHIDDLAERRKAALRSPHLAAAYSAYEQGFKADLNYAYAGLNALGLLVVRTGLAGTAELAGEWDNLFDSDEKAAAALRELQERRKDLEVVVRCTLEAAREQAPVDRRDPWTDVSLAEMRCLTGQAPARVARAYGDALMNQGGFDFEAVRLQLRTFQMLGLLGACPGEVLTTLDALEKTLAESTYTSSHAAFERVLLFVGHRVDELGRARPRFPLSAEQLVRESIVKIVEQEVADAKGPVLGIASGACGGEILFHEVCAEVKPSVVTRLYLPVPQEKYVPEWVARDDGNWVERFYRLCAPGAPGPRILSDSRELPRWLHDRADYGLSKRTNLWMLLNALARGAARVKLIALWDGEAGDAQDGTAHMVQLARQRGIEVIQLDTRRFGTAEPLTQP